MNFWDWNIRKPFLYLPRLLALRMFAGTKQDEDLLLCQSASKIQKSKHTKPFMKWHSKIRPPSSKNQGGWIQNLAHIQVTSRGSTQTFHGTKFFSEGFGGVVKGGHQIGNTCVPLTPPKKRRFEKRLSIQLGWPGNRVAFWDPKGEKSATPGSKTHHHQNQISSHITWRAKVQLEKLRFGQAEFLVQAIRTNDFHDPTEVTHSLGETEAYYLKGTPKNKFYCHAWVNTIHSPPQDFPFWFLIDNLLAVVFPCLRGCFCLFVDWLACFFDAGDGLARTWGVLVYWLVGCFVGLVGCFLLQCHA